MTYRIFFKNNLPPEVLSSARQPYISVYLVDSCKPLSLSPKDMDFLAARNGAAREIALAFGVPPLLLGLPGDATLSNYAEANRAFWRLTVVPLVSRTMRALAHWLGPAYGAELRFEPDTDRVEALADERGALWKRVSEAEFLTEDEKRAAVGYGPRQ